MPNQEDCHEFKVNQGWIATPVLLKSKNKKKKLYLISLPELGPSGLWAVQWMYMGTWGPGQQASVGMMMITEVSADSLGSAACHVGGNSRHLCLN